MPLTRRLLLLPPFALLTVWVALSSLYAAEWHDPALPMADSEKPVYQWVGWLPPGGMWFGGKCYKVRIPNAEDYKEQLEYEHQKRMDEIKFTQIKVGNRIMLAGIAAIVLGVVAHACSSLTVLNRMSEYIIAGGACAVVCGMLYKQVIEHERLILLCLGLIVIAYALSRPRVRAWSVSHIFNKEAKNKSK